VAINRRKKEEGRRKKEEGRGKKEEGRGMKGRCRIYPASLFSILNNL